MGERSLRSASTIARRWARWIVLGIAVVMLVVFLLAQRHSADISYGQSPSRDGLPEGSAGELTGAQVPPVAEMTAMLADEAVVRLPGAVATWDEQQVRALIGDADIRILVAPPGLDEAAREQVREVETAQIRVLGTEVAGDGLLAVSNDLAGWRAQFATGDVTGQLLTMAARLVDQPAPPDADPVRWRDPTDAELAEVVADLSTTGWHAAPGATLTGVPEAADEAFPDGALFVALPAQPAGQPLPRYGPPLAEAFPGTPVVLMYGSWIEYQGPYAAEFADVAAVSFYTHFGARLSRYDYPQHAVLHAYLSRVADIRYAGLFDQPLPYQPFDPSRVAFPALPWIFAGCVVAFLVLSMRVVRGASAVRAGQARGEPGARARLAGLSALAVELSVVTGRDSDPALARGISYLQAARAAMSEQLPDQHVRQLLDDSHAELDTAAQAVGLTYLRPHGYLEGRLA